MEYQADKQPLRTPVSLPKIPQAQKIYGLASGDADGESSGHEHSPVQNIEHQNAKWPLLTPAYPPEIPQEKERCGLASECTDGESSWHESSPVQTMEHQGEEQPLLTPAGPSEISQEQEICGLASGSAGRESSGYENYPVQIPDLPEYRDKYQNNLNLVASPATIRSPSWGPPMDPPMDRRGLFSGGWRTGCTYFAIIATAVFLANLIFTVWALSVYGYDSEEGVGTLYEGSCKRTTTLNSVAHLFINALSTVLLSASNYTMECLSAPTREEIDTAHRGKKWLDIGVLSVRNLCRISRLRVILFCLLAMSSIPLHFLYNSAIIPTITSYDYTPWIIAEMNLNTSTSSFQRLEKKECMEAYGKQYITDRNDVVVVISGNGSTDAWDRFSNHGSTRNEMFAWICQFYPDSNYEFCDPKNALAQVDSWKVNGTDVLYCLSQKMDERCLLQYSLSIMVVVLICNAAKSICIFLAVFRKGNPLMTVGDAIVSFLDTPDGTTVGMCIVSKEDIKGGAWGNATRGIPQVVWGDQKPFWFRAGDFGRWVMCHVLSLIGLGAVLWVFIHGLGPPYVSHWWRREKPLFGSPYDLLSCVFSANLPQVIISSLYLQYNSLFTCMLLGLEWDGFSYQYRPLRVTTPVGEQKSIPFLQTLRGTRPVDKQGSTYYLHLPYIYSLPLMVTSGLVHWLISQSIFLARVIILRNDMELGATVFAVNPYYTQPMVRLSPAAIVLMITVSTLMLVVTILTGFRSYRGGIPVVGSCSAAISAACHPDPSEAPVGTGPVMWGVVGSNNDGVGHCSFSNSSKVTAPVPGQQYAGQIP